MSIGTLIFHQCYSKVSSLFYKEMYRNKRRELIKRSLSQIFDIKKVNNCFCKAFQTKTSLSPILQNIPAKSDINLFCV